MESLSFSSSRKWDSHIISIACVMMLHISIVYLLIKPKQELRIEPKVLKIQMIAAPIISPTPKVAPKPQTPPTPQVKRQVKKTVPTQRAVTPPAKKIAAKRGLSKPKEIIQKSVISVPQKTISKPLPPQTPSPISAQKTENQKQFNQFTSASNNNSSANMTAQTPSTGQNSITKPVVASYLHNPAPQYPDIARRRRQEGTVILNILVSKAGTAKQVSIYKSSGFSMLDESATNTVRRWKFIPAEQGGMTLEMSVKVPIKFQLR